MSEGNLPKYDSPGYERMGSSSFDYDADYFGLDNDVAGQEEEALSWRLDPDESLSDWTIVIQGQHSGSSDTYHVHKNILAVGPRKSDYFASLFRISSRVAESETKTSHITLEDSAAKVFPCLLDFMYSPVQRLVVTTENAVALRYMSQYFGIRLLHSRVLDFVRNDMTLDTVPTYISDSLLFHDERMLSLAADKCTDNIQNINSSSPLLESIDPSFFLRIISSAEIDTFGESSHLSKLVAAYCKCHNEELDGPMLEKLTSKTHMPLIHRDAALPLLELEASFVDSPESKSPSCLQKRCIKVLSLQWKDISSQKKTESSVYRKLPSPVLAELLEKSLTIAKQNCDELERSSSDEAQSVRKQYEDKFSSFAVSQKTHEEELEKLRKETADKIAQLKSIVAERDRQMAEYEKDLNKFIRVPVTHSFRSVTRSTYHHLSGNEPFDTSTNRYDRFGRVRPTAIPRFGDSAEDGYLYTDAEGVGNDQRWPVYYYKDE